MTKQEQIEEMCEAIASMICEIYKPQCDEYEPHTCSHCFANSTKIGDFAEMLYNAGYRKVDEVRKETAKEILDKLNALMEQYHYKSTAWRNCANFIKETYGVEVNNDKRRNQESVRVLL